MVASDERSVQDMAREFFSYYPDYLFCRTLAVNVREQVTSYGDALSSMARKARAAELNQRPIQKILNLRKVCFENRIVRLKELSLRQILRLDPNTFREVVEFYFKHPYAHGRTKQSRWWPRWFRTLFLSALVGHARRQGVELDYDTYFEILKLL